MSYIMYNTTVLLSCCNGGHDIIGYEIYCEIKVLL